jgi:hypothetical protein
VFAIDDTVSVVSGNHEMGFGVNLGHWDSTSYSRTGSDANWSFSGARTGLGLADFMLGYASAFQSGMPIVHYKRSYLVGVFGTDSWRLPRNVTLTYGLRWEPYFPMRHRDGAAIHFDEDAFRKGIRSSRFDNTPPGVFFDGDPGFPGQAGINDKWWNFTPRAGLAWDVHGDGRMSVRASAGLFYDFPNSHYMVGTAAGAPFAPRVNLTTVSFEDPWAGYPGGDPFPTGGARRDAEWPAFSQVTATEYDAPNAQTFQWNLSLQRQIGTDWMASAAYLGSGTTHLWSVRQLNPAVYIPGVGNANGNCVYNGKVTPFTVQPGAPCSVRGNNDVRRRLYLENPATGGMYGDIPLISPTGVANYNGLLLSVQRRPARGVSVSANYTWSHCISEPAVGPGTNAYGTRGNVGWRDDNRRLDRGPCHAAAEDRRHLFNFSGVAETPQFSGRALRVIASNWRLSPILKIGSGAPYVVYTNLDPTLTGLRMVALNQVLPNLYGDKSAGNYLNPRAFALPETGTWGNLPEGSVRGPGYWQFDVALSRSFQFSEDQRLELRAEAFNVTNSVVLNHPSDTFSSGTGSQESTFESSRFGTLSSARPPRIMQFALKYFF